MHTPPSNGVSSAPGTSSPTTAQVHQGQLQDYELLRSVLREEVGSLSSFSQTLLRPQSFSPLHYESETGQEALQQLLVDPDYRALCKKNNISPHYLIVTLKEGAFVYETSGREGANKIELPLTGNENWQALRTRIEKAATLLGGEIRYDRLISAPRIATFYGLHPWDPANTAKHQAAIDTLEEKIASFQLGLEDDFNILDLKPTLKKEDRQVSFQGVLTTESRDELQGQFIKGEIKRVIQSFLPDGVTSPLTHLANDILGSATPEKVDVQPTVFLQKILQSPEAEKLGTALLTMMDWYGGKMGEETSPHVRTKVVAQALQIWFKSQTIEYPDRIAGYDLKSNLNWGKSYKEIWREFKDHLFTSKRAISKKEATVMARLFLHEFPTEFRISDIPKDLPYRSSVVWVNFVHGVNLAHAIDPALLQRLKFQELVDFPINQAVGASADYLDLITLERLRPALEWAITNGFLEERSDFDYSTREIEFAVSTLDDRTTALKNATTDLDKPPPERLAIAKREMVKLFGPHAFTSDGHRLIAEAVRADSIHDTPIVKHETFSFLDVYASGKFDQSQKWFRTTPDGKNRSSLWIHLDKDRKIQIHKNVMFSHASVIYMPANKVLPDANALFQEEFNRYIELSKSAYKKLISSQLASLPLADRQAIEYGTVTLYCLRKATSGDSIIIKNGEFTNSVNARKGFILRVTYQNKNSYYECLPSAGVIHPFTSFDKVLIGGTPEQTLNTIGPVLTQTISFPVRTLPLDWNAYETGTIPIPGASCKALIQRLGSILEETPPEDAANIVPQTLSSRRSQNITGLIADNLMFFDEAQLLAYTRGETEFDRMEAKTKKVISIIKMYVPFWSNIEDIVSGNGLRIFQGVFGLVLDLTTFLIPIGKFVSGTMKLAMTAGKLGIRVALPRFGNLTKKLLIATLQNLHPLDGLPSLLKSGSRLSLRLARKGALQVKSLTGRAGQYNLIGAMAQSTTPSTWKPLAASDQLATVRGIEDIPIRNTGTVSTPSYHLIEPLSGKPYGPRLNTRTAEVSIGRSEYSTVAEIDNRVVFELPESARVQNVPEVDGRSTLLIDHVPYRLDKGTLRRVDTIDASETLKRKTCRIRRAPGDTVCLNSYVHGELAPTPIPGSHTTVEGYSPWFGDKIYTPAPAKAGRDKPVLALDGQLYIESRGVWTRYEGARKPLGLSKLQPKVRLEGTIEFQEGMYGRIKVSGVYDGLDDDLRQVGTLIIQSKTDAKTEYLFTQLNATDYYFAEITKGQSLAGAHRLQRIPNASLQTDPLYKELHTVFIGSIQANNTARIYGLDKVKQAVNAMNEIAIPLGGLANPPANLSLVKVATTPGEAVMFDHRTRMIVCEFPITTKTWTRTKAAPESLRQQTAAIFNDLFQKQLFKAGELNDLYIAKTMKALQSIVNKSNFKTMKNPRNIGYAQITRADGHTEVYVSVSGAGHDTNFLPLFKTHNTREVTVGTTTYINVDFKKNFERTSLSVSAQGKLESIPRTIPDMSTYTPELTKRPTSLDSESKLIKVIRDKYPDDATRGPVTVVTTMAPCDSCSVVMQQFAHSGGEDALKVIWD